MPNLKFSQFSAQTDPANVQFLVGYNGTANVRIAPGDLGGGGLPFLYNSTAESLYVYNIPSSQTNNAEGNTGLGYLALNQITDGDRNTAFGYSALDSVTSGADNAAFGYYCGQAITTGQANVLMGRDTGMFASATFTGNILLGYRAGYQGQGNYSVSIGYEAGKVNTATGTISIGYQSGFSNTSGAYNTNIGSEAGKNNTTSQGRTMIGNEAGTFQTGSQNTGIGRYALRQGTGLQNTALGHSAMVGNMLGGSFNTVLGYNAMPSNGTKNSNVVVGKDAARLMTTGSTNTILGTLAGDNLTTGSNNILIGYDATASAVGVSNEITLGDANITALRIPGLQSGASDGDVLTFASGTGLITLQAAGGGGASDLNGLSDCLIDTSSQYVGTVPAGLSGNPQRNTTLGIGAGLDLTTGTQHTLIGNLAGENIVNAQDGITAVGYKAGANNNVSSFNTYMGNEAGRDHTGAQSVFAGGSTRVFSSGQTSNGVVTVGYAANDQKAGDYSVAVGYSAGNQASGIYSVYVGRDAGKTNSAVGVVALGYEAGRSNVGGNGKVAVGYKAGYTNTSGSWNMNLGYFAGYSNSTGSRNVVLGTEAGYNNIGDDGVFIGYQAGYQAASSLNRSTMIGAYAGRDVGSTRFGNTFIGYFSGRYYNSNVNCFVGNDTGKGNSSGATGFGNTAFGGQSFTNSTTSSGVVAVGYQCLKNGTNTGSNIVAVGANIHVSDTITGSNLVILGEGASASSTSVSNEITLGNASIGTIRAQVTSITAISDERDKTSIETIPYGLEFVNSLQPKKFVWDHRAETDSEGNEFFSSNKGKKDIGFIAQELQSVDDDYLNLVYDENPEKLEATYGRLIPVLVQAIKELKAEVELLKNK